MSCFLFYPIDIIGNPPTLTLTHKHTLTSCNIQKVAVSKQRLFLFCVVEPFSLASRYIFHLRSDTSSASDGLEHVSSDELMNARMYRFVNE